MSRLKSLLAVLSSLSTFTLFPKLAPEIRDMIFGFARLQPRTVNLLSTLSDPAPPLKSTIPGQSRQPAIMEVCRESRSVGKRFYTLVTSIPRKRCIKREGAGCLRCIYESWSAAHETEVDAAAEGDLHWVNFEIDGFVLKLSDMEHFGASWRFDEGHFLNFGKIKWLTALTDWDVERTGRLAWKLENILTWAYQLQEITLASIGKKMMVRGWSYVGLERAHTKLCAIMKPYLMRSACQEIKDKLLLKWEVSDEDEIGGDIPH
ncbi:hypothetical protein L207DRAFT_571750 [Hyaloscypha variabilis F]|uniref:2EXR domain-containing protein n=1 Tax=Hyaloscypha variabilis (strain UAMH 11265 / GT02V1 / F) TaxID=1149755 RepID=A0A2J6R371_HYAVF|nr:hypothetical protein L207DRAFT_571750 [Hyaloscypha variabilis F]